MTKEEFLLDGINYYAQDPANRRCSGPRDCFYSPETAGKRGLSEGCFIGRHLPKEVQLEWDNRMAGSIRAISQHDSLWQQAPDILKSFDIKFLSQCQRFHDDSLNWADVGLSPWGKKQLQAIIKINDLDPESFKSYLE